MNVESTTAPLTSRRPGAAGILVGLLIAAIITVLGLATRADAVTPPSTATGNSLSQAETLASPSVVLIEYDLSATAQNIQTGQVFTSFTSKGPITTSFIEPVSSSRPTASSLPRRIWPHRPRRTRSSTS